MMKRSGLVLGFLAVLFLFGTCGSATSVGFGLGLDPTGIVLISAITETPVSDSLELRAEAGVSTKRMEGLMLASAALLYHYPVPPIDPFVGLGVGVALTPPPFSTGMVAEGVVGIRVIALEPICFFFQARFLVRWSGAGVTTGPVYEAGAQLRF
jgi:hypothetical protein